MTTLDFDIASDTTIADFLTALARHSGTVTAISIDPGLDIDIAASVTATFPNDTIATCYLLDIGIDPDDIDIYLPSV